MTVSEIDSIVDFYNSVKSLRQTSDRFNLSFSTVRRLLIGRGVNTSIDRDAQRRRKISYDIDENYFESIDSSDKAYILGVLFSDGHMYKNRKQVRLKLTDIDLLDEIKLKMGYKKPYNSIKKYKESHKDAKLLIICNTKIYDDLIRLGCGQNKTYDCQLPKISDQYMFDFIRGFFDGDGSIWVDNSPNDRYRQVDINIVATVIFCQQLCDFLKKYKVESIIRVDKRHDARVGILRIKNVKSVDIFYHLIYDNLNGKIFLNRKYNKFTDYIKYRQSYDSK